MARSLKPPAAPSRVRRLCAPGKRRAFASAALWPCLAGVLLLSWFLLFLRPVAEPVAPAQLASVLPRQAEAVVVLTGGPERVQTGIALLVVGAAPRLMVSGVFDDVTDESFRLSRGISPELFACCITLGREARDTFGNAREIAEWARARSLRRLLVVTSDFHLRRALLELGRAYPEGAWIPVPVESGHLSPAAWVRDPALGWTSLTESFKYMLALLGLSRFGPAQLAGRA